MRLIVIAAFVVAVLLLLRLFGPQARRLRDAVREGGGPIAGSPGAARPDARTDDAAAGEQMVRCAHCGLHLPASEAVYASGRAYCGEAHRDEARRASHG